MPDLPVISLKEFCLQPTPGAMHVWTVVRRSDWAKRLFTPEQFCDWFRSVS